MNTKGEISIIKLSYTKYIGKFSNNEKNPYYPMLKAVIPLHLKLSAKTYLAS